MCRSSTIPCPVCRVERTEPMTSVDNRNYWRCPVCQARFLDPRRLPDPAGERAHYDLHENDPDDPGYRAFLARLADPLLKRLQAGQSGLDYGCGPGPALARMLEEAGHRMALYDPIYARNPEVLNGTYDFITCTETAEHFHDPAAEFRRLNRMLHPGGLLAVMTMFQTDDERFAGWHYRRDPTHVVFYRTETMEWLAGHHGWAPDFPARDVVIFRKPEGAAPGR